MKDATRAAKAVASQVTEAVRANTLRVDNLGPLPSHRGVAIPNGIVLLLEVWQAPPGEGIRVPAPHDYRLMAALTPGISPEEYNLFGLTVYQIAFNLGARPEHLVELTNTYLTLYKDVLTSTFLSPAGTILTVSWPYTPQVLVDVTGRPL